uniref:EML-like second beta-propeller domain-containing protein n=1 Tax=Romanomermis culicivorax TaxID=13658 RepID=A0A915IE11_ROMCU
MQGHSDDITCLDIDPQREQFLTGSLDNYIRCWDVLSHSPVWSTPIEEHIESICYHPDGQSFLVGCDLGRWYALDLTTREILMRKRDGCDPISCLSHSPNVQLLAIGSTNSNIYLYSCVGRHYEKIGMCSGHTAPITNLDWASNSRFFRSNSEVLELIHWDAKMRKMLTNPEDFRNVKWPTNSCILSYNTAVLFQGAWLSEEAESQYTCLISSCDSKNHLLATYDSQCRVTLRPFPCFYGEIEQSTSRRLAHCSRTGRLKFTSNSTRLISIGRKDLSLIQWTV